MWVTPSSIQSAFAQASRCSTKDSTPDLNSWASEAARSSTLSGKLSPSASWLRAWKKDHWLQRLSGLAISPNSQQDDFAAWWTASLRDSPAKICPLRAVVPASMASDPAFSSTYSTSQTIAVRGSSFWRTSQASLLPPPPLWTKKKVISKSAPPPESWENWPTVGGMRNGSLYRRPMWVPATGALDGSASPGGWPTPDCNTATYSNGERGQNIREAASLWMTPHGMGGMEAATGKVGGGGEFAKQATHWMTPRATDGSKGGPNQAGSKGDLMLPSMAAQWPTPQAHDSVGGKTPAQIAAMRSKGHGVSNLNEAAPSWPTPTARDHKGSSAEGGVSRMDGKSRMDQLANAAVFSHLGQPTPDGLESLPDSPGSLQPSASSKNSMPRLLSARLNPYFVEFLMGWKEGWTSPIVQPDSAPVEMALYRCALQARLSSLFSVPASSKDAA
jgi:hypothetical protein